MDYYYFEFHLARTSIWGDNNLQGEYAEGAPRDWGGYLYDRTNGMDWDFIKFGSGPKQGSSGHFGLLPSSKTVPLPDAPEIYRTVSGMKFLDANNNGAWDTGEDYLPGWTINLEGYIEDIFVTHTTTTGPDGTYRFGNLSYAPLLEVYEIMKPGYVQTYPNALTEDLPIGAEAFEEIQAGMGSWRWKIPIMLMPESVTEAVTVSGVDFGNRASPVHRALPGHWSGSPKYRSRLLRSIQNSDLP